MLCLNEEAYPEYETVKVYVFALLLLNACDVELNPGPPGEQSTTYLCGMCNDPVTWDHQAVSCETCAKWYHIGCHGISPQSYEALHSSTVVWHCHLCGYANHATTLFDITSLISQNTFSMLDTSTNTVASIGSSPGALQAASSPRRNYTPKPTKMKQPLRLVSINFQSIKNKKAQVLKLLNSTKADIIVGTETWLTPDFHSSEFFPPNQYKVFRKDRPDGHGGVSIATSREFIFDEVPELNSDCEGLWVKTSLAGQPQLYVGAFYRPNQKPEHLDALQESLEKIRALPNKSVIIAGDFNLPYMDWDTQCHIASKPYKN